MDEEMGVILEKAKEKGDELEFFEYFYTIISACVMHGISPTPEAIIKHAEKAYEQVLGEV